MLRQAGICLAVDEFGLGHWLLRYFKLVTNAVDNAIAATIVAMGITLV